MSYLPFHHKYRPQTFADLVGQEAIASTLTNALRSQKIAPAYLFTGPRGTGKTSSARIFAKSLNCMASDVPTAQPCGQCPACQSITLGNALDVIEIDAASNTGVDNIREIIERAQYAPVQCRYKVYTIDECHMLSTAAFNSLLKTLEEPPLHVVFILATTDPQRVLPTIISRCQKFDYRRIPLADMVKHLTYIAQQEQMQIVPSAIQLVAQIAQGGLRDAESLLDQLSLMTTTVTIERVWDLVGAVPEQDLLAIGRAIQHEQLENLLDTCRQLSERGKEPLMVLQNLAGFYRDLSIAKTIPQRPDLTNLTPEIWPAVCELATQMSIGAILAGQQHLKNSEQQLKGSTQPRLWLEVTLLGLLPGAVQPAATPRAATAPALQPEANPIPLIDSQPAAQPPALPLPLMPPPAPMLPTLDLEATWKQVLNQLLPSGKGLFAPHGRLLAVEGDVATVGMKSSTFLKLAEGQKQHLQKALGQILDKPIVVLLQLGEVAPTPAAEPKTVPAIPADSSPALAMTTAAEIPEEPAAEHIATAPEIPAPQPITPSHDLGIVREQPSPFSAGPEPQSPIANGKSNGNVLAKPLQTSPSQPDLIPIFSTDFIDPPDSIDPDLINPEEILPQFTDLDLDAAAARLAQQFGGEIVAEYVTIWDL